MLSPSGARPAPLVLDEAPPKEHDRCLRCNRVLTDPVRRRRGFGEACDERGRYERIMGWQDEPVTLTLADLRTMLADTTLDPHARIIVDLGAVHALAEVKVDKRRRIVRLVVGPVFPPKHGKARKKREGTGP